jgi:hypothetical protein
MLAQFAKLYSDVCFPQKDWNQMKLGGFFLLLSGWVIVAAAVAPGLLHGRAVAVFILAGLAVEILGFVLFAKSHIPVSEDNV